MHSLWRGNTLLGQLNPQLPGEGDGLFGMLDPTPNSMPVQAVSQHSMVDFPGTPVFQHLHADLPDSSSTSQRNTASDGPRTLDALMRESVPLADQLSIRDGTNAVVATRSVTIMPMPRAGRSIQQACQDAGVAFSGWVVIIALADPALGNR